ncbi:MAG TPA: Gfo/Idh/MocA family oxidoreductase [Gemmatimonadaceae bacterium]|nr:Gfo/Idh/MocA family oxidoreductase [Gemmatimonadaceae bacterium]
MPINRRDFVTTTATALAGITIVPRHVLGMGHRAPSDTLDVAVVGVGGMGMVNAIELLKGGENVVALCDVDYGYVDRSLAGRLRPRDGVVSPDAIRFRDAYEKARRYTDFRQLLEREGRRIDAVVIATPDHLHAPIAAAVMRAGKHVYVQKPLTYSVHEARALARLAAADPKLVTQMGNQGHSMEGTRRIVELIGAGVIGPVREVHVWTDRPLRYWAQGIPRPQTPAQVVAAQQQAAQQAAERQATAQQNPSPIPVRPAPPRWSVGTVDAAVRRAMAENPQEPPPGLDWDLFLGPATRDIPYHPAYHPFSWRGWVDFGVSAIGDMGAHLLDQPFWALGLEYPTTVVSSSTPWGGGAQDPGSYPLAMRTRFEFAARGARPPVSLTWYDGGLMPFLPEGIPYPGGDGGGGAFIGERGVLTYETYGNNPRVYPESLAPTAEAVPRTLPRIAESHEMNFARACKGETTASCPFAYAAPLTELMLLGVVALRAGQAKVLHYDGAAMQVTNAPEANRWLTRDYRPGWSV